MIRKINIILFMFRTAGPFEINFYSDGVCSVNITKKNNKKDWYNFFGLNNSIYVKISYAGNYSKIEYTED